MTSPPDRCYRTSEFAKLTGITPRALRHYDRLHLLEPRRSDAGYRIYTTRDLEVIEQIVALKFIGVPLKEIATVRRNAGGALADILRAQRQTLEHKSRLLARAIDAIKEAESKLQGGNLVDPALFRRIIEVIEMQNKQEEWTKQYGTLIQAKFQHLKTMPPAERLALRQEWIALVDEIKTALDEDPAGARAQGFVDRWTRMLEQVSGVPSDRFPEEVGKPMVEWLAAYKAAGPWDLSEADRTRIRATMEPFSDKRVWKFIEKARAARR